MKKKGSEKWDSRQIKDKAERAVGVSRKKKERR